MNKYIKNADLSAYNKLERVRRTSYKDKEVIIVDYSDCNEQELIMVLNTAKEFILTSNS